MVYFQLFVVLVYFIFQVFAYGCKDMEFKITKEGYALVNHSFLTAEALDDGHCQTQCFSDERCISFNFGRTTSGELFKCELNDADHKQFPDDLMPRPDSIYRMAENTCNCTVSQVCRMDFVNKNHCCNCKDPKYTTKTCDISYTVRNCKRFHTRCEEMILDGSGAGQTGICLAELKTPITSPVQTYGISVEINTYNVVGQTSYHPGLIFNVQDSENFDIIYFRPHTKPDCTSYSITQAQRVQNGARSSIGSACTDYLPPINQWFKVEIIVKPGSVKIYIDGHYATEYTGMAQTLVNRGGLMVVNNYGTIAMFRNYVIV